MKEGREREKEKGRKERKGGGRKQGRERKRENKVVGADEMGWG